MHWQPAAGYGRLKFLQANVQHKREAMPVLWKFMVQHDIDIALIQEPYVAGQNSLPGLPRGYSRAIADRPRAPAGRSQGMQLACIVYKADLPLMQDGLVSNHATVGAALRTSPPTFVISAYLAADADISEELRRWNSSNNWRAARVLIGADANSKSHLWHSGREDRRGLVLEEFIIGQGLRVMNSASTYPTFEGAAGSSNIDITLAGHD